MSIVRIFKARFLAPSTVEATSHDRHLWANNLRQRKPLYENGQLVLFDECISVRPKTAIKRYFQCKAKAQGWILIELKEQ